MELNFTLNGTKKTVQIEADTLLLDLLRSVKCFSVKRGCKTGNCGLCTVFADEKPVLSCRKRSARWVPECWNCPKKRFYLRLEQCKVQMEVKPSAFWTLLRSPCAETVRPCRRQRHIRHRLRRLRIWLEWWSLLSILRPERRRSHALWQWRIVAL